MSLLDLPALAQRLLALVVSTADDEGVTLPGRRYVTDGAAGSEAWDCAQVTIGLVQLDATSASLGGAEQITPTRVPRGVPSLPTAVLRVEVVRDSPVMDDDGAPPEPDEIHAAGVTALRDAALLHLVRSRVISDATLTDGEAGDVRVGPVLPAGPEGGLAAMAMVVAVTAATKR